jgi:hypothetical protein
MSNVSGGERGLEKTKGGEKSDEEQRKENRKKNKREEKKIEERKRNKKDKCMSSDVALVNNFLLYLNDRCSHLSNYSLSCTQNFNGDDVKD